MEDADCRQLRCICISDTVDAHVAARISLVGLFLHLTLVVLCVLLFRHVGELPARSYWLLQPPLQAANPDP